MATGDANYRGHKRAAGSALIVYDRPRNSETPGWGDDFSGEARTGQTPLLNLRNFVEIAVPWRSRRADDRDVDPAIADRHRRRSQSSALITLA